MTQTLSPVISHPELTTEQIDKATRYFASTRDALVESAAGLAGSQWDFKPAPDRWSIIEIIEHVVVVENRVHGIIGRMAEAPKAEDGSTQTQMDDFILIEVPSRSKRVLAPSPLIPTRQWSAGEVVERFLESREKTCQLLSASPLRGHVVPHPIFGPWDGYQWLLAAAAHSARHTGQIHEVRADGSFPRTLH